MLRAKNNLNGYAYALGMTQSFSFKDPKALQQTINAADYQKKVIQQVKEDIVRLYLSDSELINKKDLDTYIDSGYSVIGVKIILLNELMHPIFYKITKKGAKIKHINGKVQNFKSYIDDVDLVHCGGFESVDYFIAWK